MEAQRVNATSVIALLQEYAAKSAGKKLAPVPASPSMSDVEVDHSTASSSDVQH